MRDMWRESKRQRACMKEKERAIRDRKRERVKKGYERERARERAIVRERETKRGKDKGRE